MENTKEMSRVEQALQTMRDEIKKAFLNEELEVDYSPSDHNGYYASVKVKVGHVKFSMTVAETYVCYHDEFIQGIFDDKEDFKAMRAVVDKHVKCLTPEDIASIEKLKAEIEDIKRGKEQA